MRRLSFGVIFFCIFLPPVLFIFSIQGLERIIQRRWSSELRGILVADSTALLHGRIRVQDEIQQNVDRYFSERRATKWGVLPHVVVRTTTGRWLYPYFGQELSPSTNSGAPQSRRDRLPSPTEALKIARDNMEIMEEGLTLSLKVEIPTNTWLGNTVLSFYILLFSFILYRTYRVRAREAEHATIKHQRALESASADLRQAQDRLNEIAGREGRYRGEIETLRARLAVATEEARATEDEALAEIAVLERRLKESAQLGEKMEGEVLRLRQELERLEAAPRVSTDKLDRQLPRTLKRFATIYRNLEFHPRAIEGFLNLQSDQQLKAEEFIHNLNDDSSRVVVKRKVFARKGALPTFESEFAYRGRVYWNRTPAGKIQVLAIGTKNTQAKDLAFLESLGRDA